MTFARFEPWTLLDLANHDVNYRSKDPRLARSGCSPAREWAPAVDILEENDRFVMRADVPGVEPADIDVSIDNDILSITGQRNVAAGSDDDARKRIERFTGRFARRFSLPDAVDAEGITARCTNGILEVVILKAPDVPARRITVKAA